MPRGVARPPALVVDRDAGVAPPRAPVAFFGRAAVADLVGLVAFEAFRAPRAAGFGGAAFVFTRAMRPPRALGGLAAAFADALADFFAAAGLAAGLAVDRPGDAPADLAPARVALFAALPPFADFAAVASLASGACDERRSFTAGDGAAVRSAVVRGDAVRVAAPFGAGAAARAGRLDGAGALAVTSVSTGRAGSRPVRFDALVAFVASVAAAPVSRAGAVVRRAPAPRGSTAGAPPRTPSPRVLDGPVGGAETAVARGAVLPRAEAEVGRDTRRRAG